MILSLCCSTNFFWRKIKNFLTKCSLVGSVHSEWLFFASAHYTKWGFTSFLHCTAWLSLYICDIMCFNSFKLYFQYHGWSNPWFFFIPFRWTISDIVFLSFHVPFVFCFCLFPLLFRQISSFALEYILHLFSSIFPNTDVDIVSLPFFTNLCFFLYYTTSHYASQAFF